MGQAMALHRNGNLPEAESIYSQLLGKHPDDFDAQHFLGVLRYQQGRHDEALRLIGTALKTKAGDVGALFHQGLVLASLKRHEDAVASFDSALSIKPDSPDALYHRAIALGVLDRLEEALATYDRLLAFKPDHVEALTNRGNVLRDVGRHDEALASYDAVLAIKPDYAVALYNRGVVLQELHRLEEALAGFDRVLAVDPDHVEALNNRGNVLQDLKRLDDALASYDRLLAIKPNFAQAYNNRANALRDLNRREDALVSYDKAVALDPANATAWSNRGAVLQEMKRHNEALASYDKALASYHKALAADPRSADTLNKRGLALWSLRRFDEALASYERALAIQPNHAEALRNRGTVLRDLNRRAEALASYVRALAVEPDDAVALNGRGLVLAEAAQFDEALISYDRAIALRPDYVEALSNRGLALQGLNRLDEALTNYDHAIALKPDYAQALLNRAMCRLLAGQYVGGWADYEWRWAATDNVGPRPPYVNWQGEDLKDRRLLVFAEQGLGDVIQYVRYLPIAARVGCRVTFLATPSLARLLPPAMGGIEVASSLPREREFDFQCALMSLPHRLGTDETSIPAAVPYLRAEDALVDRWQKRIGPKGFKVGICWQGNPTAPAERGRSIPLDQFRILGQVPGVRLISLQKNHGLDQLARIPADMTVETLGDDFDGGGDAFVDCAAVMHALDLVVTSDTAVAHLAGALGRPVWLLLQHVPHWTWMLDRSDSPWYPSMRLFRQTRRDHWDSVFDEIAAALRVLVGQQGRQPGGRPGNPQVPISWGDLIDKITILEVKSERLTSPQPLANVRRELAALEAVLQAHGDHATRVAGPRAASHAINGRLFDIEDAIRDREARQLFDAEFIQLARSIYFANDERGRIKREVNAILNSELVEEKQYAKY
jgi:tetratricopeptide (TPR) repeat protein